MTTKKQVKKTKKKLKKQKKATKGQRAIVKIARRVHNLMKNHPNMTVKQARKQATDEYYDNKL